MSMLSAKSKKLFVPAITGLGIVLILIGLINLIGVFRDDDINNDNNPQLVLWAPSAQAQTVCNDNNTIDPGDSISSAVGSLNSGDTLCLANGTYNQMLSVSVSGTASQPITIKAVNDGKAIIDGQGQRGAILISGNYIVVEGLIARNGGNTDGLVKISGDYNILRRISGYDMNPNERAHIFLIYHGDYNLLEDCAATGTGRYRFDTLESRHNTFRRCYASYGQCNVGSPRAGFCPYGSPYSTFENCIARDVYPSPNDSSTSMEYYGFYQETNQNPEPSNNCKYYGNISYNNLHGGMRINPSTGPNTTMVDMVFFDHDRSNIFTPSQDGWTGWGVYGGQNDQGFRNLIMSNNTFINNRRGGAVVGPNPIINSIFMQNSPALGGTGNHEYCSFYNNSSLGTSINSTDLVTNPNFDLNKYGQGAYLFSPPALQDKGKDGADIGANVLYRYHDGELTNEPLWEWPMEKRICDETGISVTWENSSQISAKTGQRCTGGLWKTLDGIYGSQPAVPNLALSKSASPLSATPGQTITYTIHYSNTGTVAADSTVIKDIIPAGVQFVTGSITASHSSAQCGFSNNTLTCNYPTIPAGAEGEIRFEARVE